MLMVIMESEQAASKMINSLINHNLCCYFALVSSLFCCFSCEPGAQISPLPPRFTGLDLPAIPGIVIAEAMEDCHPLRDVQISAWNGRPVQLWKVHVRVEHVLQGDITQKTLDIPYFVDQGMSTGGVSRLTDIKKGSSEVFFLQRDGSYWRTICEGWRSCVFWIRTGTHYRSKIDLNLPIADILIDLMLSRGDRTDDRQIIDAIYHPEGRWGWMPVINALHKLANQEKSPVVRSAALKQLQKLQRLYGQAN
jgi:hypothetical protein